ncbi:hypothetical protein L1987_72376 [Smallanthus sonchifolius]|uniref:Uncharacterized protein n=1 Tax=Smallanthus sonchifolius TaxID=185202 RepID=A0ACB9AVY0_9ASTR|nr:hypothetical protein L1987_72376 [Smallanthus sonchifolius]
MHSNPFNMQYHQSSYNAPTVINFEGSNNEVQVSTASSPPSESTKLRDVIHLFPAHPPAEGPTERTRAITVVPRNAKLASESVAQIFLSIQEERKLQEYDPV